jgi:AraC-like DNA-binding protein
VIKVVRLPPPPLSDLILCLWYQEHEDTAQGHERILPDGSAELIINLREDRLPVINRASSGSVNYARDYARGSLLYGPHTDYFVIDPAAGRSILGIHFKPGGAAAFFGVPADELHNRIVPLDALWGGQADVLRDRLIDSTNAPNRFQIVENFLLARLAKSRNVHPAVRYALNLFQVPTAVSKVTDVVDQIGISARRFSHLFREQVGTTPKSFHRVQRFHHTTMQIDSTIAGELAWADLALSCGFFDQAHFVHEFRAFAGMTPLEYAQNVNRRPGHIPVQQ